MIFVSFLVEKIKGETKIIFESLTKDGWQKKLNKKRESFFVSSFWNKNKNNIFVSNVSHFLSVLGIWNKNNIFVSNSIVLSLCPTKTNFLFYFFIRFISALLKETKKSIKLDFTKQSLLIFFTLFKKWYLFFFSHIWSFCVKNWVFVSTLTNCKSCALHNFELLNKL